MSRVYREPVGQDGWPGGVSPATDAVFSDVLTSPRGRNSALATASSGKPYVQKRMGLGVLTATPITGTPAVIGQFLYHQISTGVNYQLLVSNNRRLDYRDTDGTLHTISATAFTTGDLYPSFSVMNDLCFMVNGTDAKKLRGAILENFGLVRPTVGSLSGAAGAAGSPNGTYELRESFYNGNTGHESSVSDTAAATVTVVSQKIVVSNVAVSTDAQTTARRIYIRNINTQANFYLAGTIADNVTTTITLDFIDANLVTVAPSTTSNNPPPSGAFCTAIHVGRQFLVTPTGLYWSNLNAPEAFNPLSFDGVDTSSGQRITGIISVNEVLVIFKEDRTYVLYGDDPNTWTIKLINPDYGCATFRTMIAKNSYLWWWSRHGFMRWQVGGTMDPIGLRLYGDPNETVNYAAIAAASVCADDANNRIYMAVPEIGQAKATMILPINVIMNVFESDKWDPMDAASLGVGLDASGVERPFLGNYAGQVFQLWSTNNDGVSSGTLQGTFVPGASTVSSITDLSATFLTTGGKLIERKVTIFDSTGRYMTGNIRPRITANTGTVLTLSTTLSGFVAGQTYTYMIGGPDYQFDTPWLAGGNDYFTKEKYDWFFFLMRGLAMGLGSRIDIFFDHDNDDINPETLTITTASSVSTWDDPSTLWDISVWDSPTTLESKYRVHRTGKCWRARVRNSAPNQPFAQIRLAMQSVTQTIKD